MDIVLVKLFLAVILISIVAALVGTFTFLQKKALISDALSHAVLPGIVIGFLLAGHLSSWLVLLSAICAGWAALQSISFLTKRTHLKSDALLAISLSSFLALGLTLLSSAQLNPKFARSGLNDFLFGKVSAINWNDIVLMSIVTVLSATIILLKWYELVARSFDETYMKTRGFNTRLLDILFNILIICSVAISVQAIGVVLTSALLIVPVTCARMFTHNIIKLTIGALIIALIASISGTTLSIYSSGLPTGPAMVIMLSAIFTLGLIIKTIQPKS